MMVFHFGAVFLLTILGTTFAQPDAEQEECSFSNNTEIQANADGIPLIRIAEDAPPGTLVANFTFAPATARVRLDSLRGPLATRYLSAFDMQAEQGILTVTVDDDLALLPYPSSIKDAYLSMYVYCGPALQMIAVIIVEDVPAPPQFYGQPYLIDVNENTAVGSDVDVPVVAIDWDPSPNYEVKVSFKDDPDPTFALEAQENAFQMLDKLPLPSTDDWSPNQLPPVLRLRVLKPLTGGQSQYSLTVTAKDSANLTATTGLIVRITNPEDSVDDNILVGRIAETAEPGTYVSFDSPVAFIALFEVPSDDRVFELEFENDQFAKNFGLDDEGGIYLLSAFPDDLDLSQPAVGVLKSYIDSDLEKSVPVSIEILQSSTDIQYPVFDECRYEAEIDEHSPANSFLLTVRAAPPEGFFEFGYVLLQPDQHFSVDFASGNVTSTRGSRLFLDREKNDRIELQITTQLVGATSSIAEQLSLSETPTQCGITTVTAFVRDINDHAPQFTQSSYAFQITDRIEKDEVLGLLSATDPDADLNGLVQFDSEVVLTNRPTDEQTQFYFTLNDLNNGSAELVTTYDTASPPRLLQAYSLVARVRDRGDPQRTSNTTITVSVRRTGVIEFPIFSRPVYNASIVEHAAVGTRILQVQAVFEAQIEDPPPSYVIDPSFSDIFQIDAETGWITVLDQNAVDYETNINFTFEVAAVPALDVDPNLDPFTDERYRNPADEDADSIATVEITVLNSNDHAPQWLGTSEDTTDLYVFEVEKDAAVDTLVGRIEATDLDIGAFGQVYYVPVEVPLFFELNNDGSITLRESLPADTARRYGLTVEARDSAGAEEQRSTTGRIEIRVSGAGSNPGSEDAELAFVNLPNAAVIDSTLPVRSVVFTVEITGNSTQLQHTDFEITLLENSDDKVDAFAMIGNNVTTALDLNSVINGSQQFDLQIGARRGEKNIQSTLTVTVNNVISTVVDGVDSTTRPMTTRRLVVTKPATIPPDRLITPVTSREIPDGTPTKPVQAPVFDQPRYQIEVAENDDSFEIQVKADHPNGPVEYDLLDDDSHGVEIDRRTGVVSIKEPIDRETTPSIALTVTACYLNQCSDAVIDVTVLDENDNSPVFDEDEFSFQLPFDSVVGTELPFVTASDLDIDTLRYRLATANEDFGVNADTGAISVSTAPLSKPTYELMLEAVDDASQIGRTRITVEVTDFQTTTDTATTVTDTTATTTIAQTTTEELTSTTTTLPETTDSTSNTQPVVTIVTTQSDSIESTLLTPGTVESTLLTSDTVEPTSSATLLNTTPVDDEDSPITPVIDRPAYRATVEENTDGFTLQIKATHPTGPIVYAIDDEGVPQDNFVIDPQTGILRSTKALDRETSASHELKVTACVPWRNTQFCRSVPVYVTVADVDDNSPEFGREEYKLTIPVDLEKGAEITRVTANDRDASPGLKYRLLTNEDDFTIDATSGLIRIARPLTEDTYEVVVEVADAGDHRSETTVILQRTGSNPDAPVFDQFVYEATVVESAQSLSPITTVAAVDAHQPVLYSIEPDSDCVKNFTIDERTGELRASVPLDYESAAQCVITVLARDSNPDFVRSSRSSVVVTIQNVNDIAPLLAPLPDRLILSTRRQPAPSGSLVFRVQANDADSTALRYSISDNPYLDLRADTAELTVKQSLRPGRTQVLVSVSDEGGLGDSHTMQIIVQNVNEFYPQFDALTYNVDFASRDSDFLPNVIYKFTATLPTGPVYYSLLPGNMLEYISIGTDTGQLIAQPALLLMLLSQTAPVYVVVRATNQRQPAYFSDVLVSITLSDRPDVSDNLTFSSPLYRGVIRENAAVGSLTGVRVQVVGGTAQQNGLFQFTLEPSDYFQISGNGTITVARPIDLESLDVDARGVYTLTVKVNTNTAEERSTTVEIKLDDEDEFEFDFPAAEITIDLSDVPRPGDVVATVTVIDADFTGPPSTITYTLIGEGSNFFSVSPDGRITVTRPLDGRAEYRITLTAFDGTSGKGVTTILIMSTSTSSTPSTSTIFNSSTIAISLPVLQPDAVVVDLSKYTGLQPDENVRYEIVDGSGDNLFSLDPSTGIVRFSGSTLPTGSVDLQVGVRAADKTDTATISVSFPSGVSTTDSALDSTSTPETGTTIALTVDENIQPGDVIGIIDQSPEDGVWYEISGPQSTYFEVRPDGSLALRPGVSVSDLTGAVTVTVVRVNGGDRAPTTVTILFPQRPQFTVQSVNVTVVTSPLQPIIVLIERISNAKAGLVFEIIGGNDDGYFTIDPQTGAITLSNPSAPSPGRVVQLVVRVRDGDMTDQITVNVNFPSVVPESSSTASSSSTIAAETTETVPAGTVFLQPEFSIQLPSGGLQTGQTIQLQLLPASHPAAEFSLALSPFAPRTCFAVDRSSALLSVTCQPQPGVYELPIVATSPNGLPLGVTRIIVTVVDDGATTGVITTGTTGDGSMVNGGSTPTGESAQSTSSAGQQSTTNDQVSTSAQQSTTPESTSDSGQSTTVSGQSTSASAASDCTNTRLVLPGTPILISSQLQANAPVYVISLTDMRCRTSVNFALEDTTGVLTVDTITGVVSLIGPPGDTERTIGTRIWVTYNNQVVDSQSVSFRITSGEAPFAVSLVFGQTRYDFEVDEEATQGTVIGTVNLQPSTTTTASFTLVFTSAFVVDRQTGVISVAPAAMLDFEDGPRRHSFIVRATDSEGAVGYAAVAVTIRDINDHNPEFTQSSYLFTILEGPYGLPVTVGSVAATDRDTNGELRYAIDESTSPFVIDSSTGVLTVATPLDRELVPSYEFHVTASDGSTPPRTTRVVVNVTLIDVNDNAPVFLDGAPMVLSVQGGYALGTVVAKIRASDRDSGANGQIHYTLEDSFGYFEVDSESGDIKVIQPIQYNRGSDTANTYILHVIASDFGRPPLSNSWNLTLNFYPNGQQRPEFLQPLYITDVSPLESIGRPFTQLSAGVGGFVYSIEYSPEPLFVVNPSTGEVSLNREPKDEERGRSHEITILAQNTTSGESASTVLRVYILSAAPSTASPPPPVNPIGPVPVRTVVVDVPENEQPRLVVDIDSPFELAGGDVMYRIVNGDEGAFTINETDGRVYTTVPLDRETYSNYVMVIEVMPSGESRNTREVSSSPNSTALYVTVSDVNDNPPYFVDEHVILALTDEALIAGVVRAYDPDTNDTVRYTVLQKDSDDSHKFQVDELTGSIRPRRSFAEKLPSSTYKFDVAADDGLHSTSASVLIHKLSPQSQAVLRSREQPAFVRWYSSEIERSLTDATGWNVTVTSLTYDPSVPRNDSTDVMLYAINPETGDPVPAKWLVRRISEVFPAVQRQLEHLRLVDIHPVRTPVYQQSTRGNRFFGLTPTEWVMAAVSCILMAAALAGTILAVKWWRSRAPTSVCSSEDYMVPPGSIYGLHSSELMSVMHTPSSTESFPTFPDAVLSPHHTDLTEYRIIPPKRSR